MDFQPKTNAKREGINAWLVPWHSQYTLVIKGIAPSFLGHLVEDYGIAEAT